MKALLVLALAIMASLLPFAADAQTGGPRGPFGAPPPGAERSPSAGVPASQPTSAFGRLTQWIQFQQATLHRELTAGLKRLKTEGIATASAALAFASFLYGVLHAAGPGHGKAVITSYALANERTARRGVALAFLAALFQALSAIVLVAIAALAFRATMRQMQLAEAWLETLSAGLITAFGAWLLLGQLRRLVRSAHPAPVQHAGGPSTHHHGPDHVHDEHCGHQHLPGPSQIQDDWNWRKAVALAFTVGLRPCSGAIIVLVFALAQGLFWAGVGATFAMALGTALTVSALVLIAVGSRELAARYGGATSVRIARVHQAASIAGSALVLLFGLLLLAASFGPARPL